MATYFSKAQQRENLKHQSLALCTGHLTSLQSTLRLHDSWAALADPLYCGVWWFTYTFTINYTLNPQDKILKMENQLPHPPFKCE